MNNDNKRLSASQFELVVSSKTIGSLTTNAKAIKQPAPNGGVSSENVDDLPF